MAAVNFGTLVKDTAVQALGGNVMEEALDHVQPGR